MMLIEDFKKDINNALREIQENMSQKVEALKKKTQKSLKEATFTAWWSRKAAPGTKISQV